MSNDLAITPTDLDLETCEFRQLFNPPPMSGSRLLVQEVGVSSETSSATATWPSTGWRNA